MARLPDCRNLVGVKALRLALATALLVATGYLTASALATSPSEKNLPSLNRQVFAAVNKLRVAHGLVALHNSNALDRSARQHSLEMGRDGYFAHSSHDGTPFWKRLQRYYHPYESVGENLVWQSPRLSAGGAMKLWIGSAPHLKNLLDPQWRDMGVSAVRVVHAPGVYGGRTVVIVTNDFGVRR